jgi:hypothetical protein
MRIVPVFMDQHAQTRRRTTKKQNTVLTCTYRNGFDMTITLRGLEHTKCSERTVQRLVRSVAIVLGGAICFSFVSAASATNAPLKTLTPKEFAQIQLTGNLYKCVSILYGKESAWNPDARNGSHYGIPQGRSEYLSRVDGIAQVTWGLKYIGNRYGYTYTHDGMQPDTCAALEHWRSKGWH